MIGTEGERGVGACGEVMSVKSDGMRGLVRMGWRGGAVVAMAGVWGGPGVKGVESVEEEEDVGESGNARARSMGLERWKDVAGIWN